ncbi:hypothetical protein V8J36_10855 [Frigidibacter sp. MR17.14]|uniref:LEM-3-like GIY-YIG domain-containing protein n=1 Tax=Frigidibacter sp. MR17.14 TaxID=3126509 RepID=UPI003012B779
MVESFSAGVSEKLQYYVYRLIDPRNGETFYVGKGRGNRIFQHLNATKAVDVTSGSPLEIDGEEAPDDDASLKVRRLNEIRKANLNVVHIIHRHGIADQKTAYEVEAALIDAYSGLSNISAGHHSNDRGPMHAQEIEDKYALPEVVFSNEKLILINVNSFDHNSPQELLNRVRYAWRVSRSRASHAEYVLAVIHGIVCGAFVAEEWLAATPENFPEFDETSTQRSGFRGHIAPEDVWDKYVGARGKRLPDADKLKSQNPVKYLGC